MAWHRVMASIMKRRRRKWRGNENEMAAMKNNGIMAAKYRGENNNSE
jgi:hypothetical protein